MADQACRCGLSLKPQLAGFWWPRRDPEPGPEVRGVALFGQDPGFLRRVRVAGGWHTEGSGAAHPGCTPPAPWQRTGQCWAQVAHPVVDVTVFLDWLDESDPAVGTSRLPGQVTR